MSQILLENIEEVFFVTSLEEPEKCHYTIFYYTEKYRSKEWNFTLNLN